MGARVLALLTGALSALVCTGVGVRQVHRGDAHSYDLAIFAQSARSWASWQLPVADVLGGKRLLGDHFSPATALFGPAWAVWPDPLALVVVQALLLGLGSALVARAAARHLPPAAAVAVAASVVLAHGSLAAARFDVHEVCLAVPPLALSATALLERRHTAAGLWALPLLLVKEDLGATVAAVALVVLCRGDRRRGVLLLLAAVAGTALAAATMVLVSPTHELARSAALSGAAAAVPAGTAARAGLVAAVVVGGGLLWVVSPVALLALPTLAWRLVSDVPSYTSSALHYDTVLVPVAGVALVDVLRRLPHRRGLRGGAAWAAAAGSAAVTALVLPVGTAAAFAAPATWRPGPRLLDLRAATSVVPAGVAVAADNASGAYLVGRAGGGHDVQGWSPDRPLAELPEWVVLATDRASVASPAAATRAWLDRAAEEPGVRVHRVGATAVVHLPGR